MSRCRCSPPDISVKSMQKCTTWIFHILFLTLLFGLKKKNNKEWITCDLSKRVRRKLGLRKGKIFTH